MTYNWGTWDYFQIKLSTPLNLFAGNGIHVRRKRKITINIEKIMFKKNRYIYNNKNNSV